ncbi:HAMP domain-containing histidine kinase [Candidatus Gracilibacteria bacterium]|nr:HAMP domain-containing histidine kinase [Candidatus Gracilibacteria bacterium]
MYITTRIKITLLFTIIIAILIAVLNTIIFETADRDWQEKQKTYVDDVMKGMFTPDEAKSQFAHLEVLSSSGVIVSQQGVFASGGLQLKSRSLFFKDAGIFEQNGFLYYIVEEEKDGMKLRMAEDFTSVINTRDMIVEKSIRTSLFGILITMIVGYIFSGFILRPIRQMNRIAEDFSLDKKDKHFKVDIVGHPKDEVVLLARSLESLFVRVRSEASRLEQFSDDIAHEIKNTLFSIQSSLDLSLHTEHKELGMKKAKTLLIELSNVVDALLFFSRNEEKNPIQTDIGKLIQSHIDTTDTRIKLIEISKKIELPIYPELFMTAVGNIISNAQKFTPKDGKITITLTKDGINITDTGIGMSESDIVHIFDRLFKADSARSSGSGYGLGLAITKKIIEDLHKMNLSVKSEEGKGTSFRVEWEI